jgi:thiamine-phosphate pyrophosphorylase
VEGGVDIIQLRAKELPAGRLLDLGLSIQQRIKGNAMLFVNDRVDVALALEADGVQLGEDAMPVEAVHRISGHRLLVGRSVHSVERAIEAEAQGADFLVVGTVFATGSKPELEPAGPELLRDVGKVTKIPFLAIGGVNTANVAQVLEYGAHGAAVISAILASPDTAQAAQGLKQAMKDAAGRKMLSSK